MTNPSTYCKWGRVKTHECLKGRTRCDGQRCKHYELNAKGKKELEGVIRHGI